MTIKLFGFYINIFRAKAKTCVDRAWQVRRCDRYLFLCDSEGHNIPLQTNMILTDKLNSHAECTVSFLVNLNHLDEEPIAWVSEPPKGGNRAPERPHVPTTTLQNRRL